MKPNTEKKQALYDYRLVLAQLRYSGMLETIRIRAAGFAVRLSFKDFFSRYSLVLPGLSDKDLVKSCGAIMTKSEPLLLFLIDFCRLSTTFSSSFSLVE